MLFFFDETFRESVRGHRLSALCGIAIPEDLLSQITTDVYMMKYSSFGEQFAKERELKAKTLFKPRSFHNQRAGKGSPYLTFVLDMLRYIKRQKIVTFGVVCFDVEMITFSCNDPYDLDRTYKALFEQIDGYMSREFPNRKAKLVFDDVGYGANNSRATAITNFFNRTSVGRGYDTIIRTPFFAISQAHNVGLQLADMMTGIVGMRFQGKREIMPYWRLLHDMLYTYTLGSRRYTSLRVFKPKRKAQK